jgi:DNA-binding protein YbaB
MATNVSVLQTRAMELYKLLEATTVHAAAGKVAIVTMNGHHEVLSVTLPLLESSLDKKTVLNLEQSLVSAFNQALGQVTAKAQELMAGLSNQNTSPPLKIDPILEKKQV